MVEPLGVPPAPARGVHRAAGPASPRRRCGLTLVELLVTLVLVSMLGTLLVQSVGFFAARYETVQRIARDAARAGLRQQWFAASVHGLVPDGVEARRFEGAPTGFQGTTLAPLEAAAGLPVTVRWSIGAEAGGGLAVGYAEDGAPRRRVLVREGPLAFRYADARGAWHERWPPPGSREWTPSQVRLEAGGRTLWLAAVDATPVPRITQQALR